MQKKNQWLPEEGKKYKDRVWKKHILKYVWKKN